MDLHLCLQKRVFFRSRFIKKVIQTIENIAPDVLILNHTLWPLATLPYLNPNIKRLLIVHNITAEELQEPKANSAWWDIVVAVGLGVYKYLLSNWPEEKVRLIPVGVNESSVPCREVFNNYLLELCYIGRLSQHQKNIFMLPLIAKGLFERGIKFRFSIIGDGEDGPALLKQIAALGLTDHFKFHGICDHFRVEKILSEQNILLLPSNYESIGHVLMESQMLGVVPIASFLKDATDTVITNKMDGILCKAGDVENFIDAISLLNSNRDEMKRLSENGRRSVRQRFHISITAKHYYQLFDNIQNISVRDVKQEKPIMGFYSIPHSLLPPRYTTIYRFIEKKLCS